MHYLIPAITGLFFLIFSLMKQEIVVATMKNIAIQEIVFTSSSTMLGFAMATYGILMSLSPNLNKQIHKSETMKSINNYFFCFLMLMLLQVIFSVIFLFNSSYYLFVINAVLFGIAMAMILFIAKGIKSIYNLILHS